MEGTSKVRLKTGYNYFTGLIVNAYLGIFFAFESLYLIKLLHVLNCKIMDDSRINIANTISVTYTNF